MQRLTIAQDTGNAIRGRVRADYFFGNGAQAARRVAFLEQNMALNPTCWGGDAARSAV